MVAFAALIRSGADFPTEWYNLRDGVFFLGDEDFGSQLKIRQVESMPINSGLKKAGRSLHNHCACVQAGLHGPV